MPLIMASSEAKKNVDSIQLIYLEGEEWKLNLVTSSASSKKLKKPCGLFSNISSAYIRRIISLAICPRTSKKFYLIYLF